VEFSSNLSAIYTKWCAQSFPPIFGLFVISDGNFAKIVGPPGDVDENYVVRLTEQSLLKKKSLKIASKSTHTGRLPWQPVGIKFTQCVSDHKSAFSPLQEKLCVGSKSGCHLLELSRRSLSAGIVWGRSNYARRL